MYRPFKIKKNFFRDELINVKGVWLFMRTGKRQHARLFHKALWKKRKISHMCMNPMNFQLQLYCTPLICRYLWKVSLETPVRTCSWMSKPDNMLQKSHFCSCKYTDTSHLHSRLAACFCEMRVWHEQGEIEGFLKLGWFITILRSWWMVVNFSRAFQLHFIPTTYSDESEKIITFLYSLDTKTVWSPKMLQMTF